MRQKCTFNPNLSDTFGPGLSLNYVSCNSHMNTPATRGFCLPFYVNKLARTTKQLYFYNAQTLRVTKQIIKLLLIHSLKSGGLNTFDSHLLCKTFLSGLPVIVPD